jgi:hypothetical protein
VIFFVTISVTFAQDDSNSLQVDASQDLGAISPYIYGANYGASAIVSVDMQESAADSGVTFFRFPGGHWGDQYDLTPFQIDLFMLQAKAWNVVPSISVRLEGGTPEKAADLVRYVNIEKKYNVQYWSIGNEPTLYKDYSIEQFNKDWRAIAEAMRAVDPNILLIGPEVHQYPSTENPPEYLNVMRQWVREFLKANGDLVNIVSVHRYPFPINADTPITADALLVNSAETDTLISLLRQDIQDTLGHDMPIAVTEMNSSYANNLGGDASMDSLVNAVWWADVLGRMIEGKVDIVDYWIFNTSPDQGFGMMDRYSARPTYYVYQLYKQFGTKLLGSSSNDSAVSIYAAKRDDGTLTLIVVNLGSDEVTKTIDLKGYTPSEKAEVWRLDSDHNAEQLDAVDLSAAVVLPGQSVTLYVVPGA